MRQFGSASRRAAIGSPAVLWWASAAFVVLAVVASPPARAAAMADGDTRDHRDPTSASIPGLVVDHENQPWLGAIVQLYTAGPSGEAVDHLRPAFSDSAGRYEMGDLDAGCYVVIVEAPAGETFPGNMLVHRHRVCVEPGQRAETLISTLAGPPEPKGPAASGAAGPAFSIDLFHLGHQGNLEPSTIRLKVDDVTAEVEVGGWPRVVTALEAEQVGSRPESTIFVHAGGVLGATALSTVFGGAADAALMNRVCFDVVAPGPTDLARPAAFDTFTDFLTDGSCQTQILTDGTALHPVGSEVVAFVTAVEAAPKAAPGQVGLIAADPLTITAERVQALVDDGYDRIVLISNLGTAADRLLIPQLPAVDAVLGRKPDLAPRAGTLALPLDRPPARFELNADGDPVCFGSTGTRSLSLGHLQIGFDADGRVVDCAGGATLLLGQEVAIVDDSGRRRSATAEDRSAVRQAVSGDESLATVRPDKAAGRALADWSRALDLLMDEPVAELDRRLCRSLVPGRTVGVLCGSGDEVFDVSGPRDDAQQIVADAFRHAARREDEQVVALISSDTVGQGLEPGTARLHDAFRLVPDNHRLVYVTLTGTELARALEEGLAGAIDGSWGPPGTTVDEAAEPPGRGAYPHTSGLRWKPDYARRSGRRVGPIEVETVDGAGWEPLDRDARYLVVTTESLVVGDRAYPTLEAAAADGRAASTTVGGAEAILGYVDDELGGIIGPSGMPPTAT